MAPEVPLPILPDFADSEAYVSSLLDFTSTNALHRTLCGGVHIVDFFTQTPSTHQTSIALSISPSPTPEPTSLFDTLLPASWRPWLLAQTSTHLLDCLLRHPLTDPWATDAPRDFVQYVADVRRHCLSRDYVEPAAVQGRKLPRKVAVGMVPKKVHEVSSFAHFVDVLARDVGKENGVMGNAVRSCGSVLPVQIDVVKTGHQKKRGITHIVDFGSGQNYLGRALASEPYCRDIVAVEGRKVNIVGAKSMDVSASLAEREVVRRNKKTWRKCLTVSSSDAASQKQAVQQVGVQKESEKLSEGDEKTAVCRTMNAGRESVSLVLEEADLRPSRELATIYTRGSGHGSIQYVQHNVQDGDLSSVIAQISQPKRIISEGDLLPHLPNPESNSATHASTVRNSNGEVVDEPTTDPRLFAVSIHSCGNLSHHGIRSLVLNPSVRAVAIVGCCYNLMTEKLSLPTYKLPYLRPNLQPVNAPQRNINDVNCDHGGNAISSSTAVSAMGSPELHRKEPPASHCAEPREDCPIGDPHGYPMSDRISTYNGTGIPLNITARMMAVQAPANWTPEESKGFFKRHYFRALLQRVFLDFGVVTFAQTRGHTEHVPDDETTNADASIDSASGVNGSDPAASITEAVMIGSLPKRCYTNFVSYVQGAIEKLRTHPSRSTARIERMSAITAEQIQAYADAFEPRRRELSVVWSLMSFSAGVVESLIVVDRWLYLMEQEVVGEAWVEAVFDYELSPRNLVVVGFKK